MGELIADLEKYSIYKVNNDVAGAYYLCIPSNNIFLCQLYLSFSDKDMEGLATDEIISIISNVNDMLLTINNGAIYIVPDISVSSLEELALVNDQKFYNRFSNEIVSPIVSEVYNMLISNGVKKNNINQYIQIITKNDTDKNIADGLSLCPGTGSFMLEKKLKDLNSEYRKIVDVTVLGAVDNSDNPFMIPIMDINENQNLNNKQIVNSGIPPVDHENDDKDIEKSKGKVLVRKPVKKVTNPNGLPGFSSFNLIIVTLFIALIFGSIIGYMILR